MPVASPRGLSILPESAIPAGVARRVPLPLPGEQLDLLQNWRDPQQPKVFRIAIILSVIVHAFIFVAGTEIQTFVAHVRPQPTVVVRRIPLYYRPELTQRAPNKDKITERFDLQDLLARQVQQQQQAASGRRRFVPKVGKAAPAVQPAPLPVTPEPPRILAQAPAPPPPGVTSGIIPPATPPPPQTANPFEKVGQVTAKPNAQITPPKTALNDIVRSMAREQASPQQLTLSDDAPGLNLPPVPGTQALPGRMGSQVELKSDPHGVDLRPYLAQILAIVRRNWFTVMPESVRMGTRRGRTVLQFAINRDGSLAKVVISDYSGSDPLDRAAVAGLSMSNPLPPLPKDYQGGQLRLSFSFDYNLPKLP